MSDYSPTQQQQNFSQSTAFAAALQRAKQIAAKIQPGPQQPSPVGGQKRPLDDFGNDNKNNKRFSGGNSPPLAQVQQAVQQARELAARLGNNQGNSMQAPSDAVQRAREVINKMVGGPGNGGGGGGGPPQHMSRPGLGSGNYNNGNSSFEEVMIPGSKVGLIIGKGGETIKQLMEKTGAKLVVVQEGPGQENEKPLRITGDYDKVQHAKQLVEELLAQKDQQQQQYQQRNNNYNNNDHQGGPPRGGYGGGGGGGNRNNHHGGGDYDNIEIVVPKAAVGVVIGKGGEMIKKIAADTGAKMQFIQGSDPNGDRRCVIQGPRHLVEDAKRTVDELVDGVLRRKGISGEGGQDMNYANYNGPMVSREEYSFTVPASKCGIIIGRGGDTIKQINSQSGAHCEMDRKASANMVNEKAFIIKGEQHQIDEAKRLIQDKINVELNMTHMGSTQVPAPNTFANNPYGVAAAAAWGAYTQQWDQSQQAAAQMAVGAQGQGQADYSQQWIEYYKQMGMHREAEMIEQQIKIRGNAPGGQSAANGQGGAGNPAGASGAAAAQGQADYSAQWAEYYRRMGKNDEAEAIEKQMAAQKSGAAPAAANPAGAPNAAQFYPQMAAYGQYQQYYGAQAYPGYPGGPTPPQPGQPQPPAPASSESSK